MFRALLDEIGVAGAALAFIPDEKAHAEVIAIRSREERSAWLAAYKGPFMLTDGHMRKDEIRQEIPTVVLDLSKDEARKALASHDAVTAMALAKRDALVDLAARSTWNNDTIATALRAVQDRYAIPLSFAAPPPVAGIEDEEEEEEPVVPTDALVKKWGTASGQLWVVPSLSVPGREHRLLCGDCRDPANVERLHEGARPNLGLHDPPYGISAVGVQFGRVRHGANRKPSGAVSGVQRGGKAHKRVFAPIVGDEQRFDPRHLHGSEVVVLWGANHYADKLPPSAEWFVWVKIGDDIGESDFSSAELAWVSPPDKRKGHVRIIAATPPKGLHVEGEQRLHPTQKPVKVQRAPIEWYTAPGDLVADWYMGAGAVIIACEQTGRIGHGMDIAPAYLAATLERLAARGLKPRLHDGKG